VPRYVVLLRGINVGKAKRVAMADLRALLAGAGYTDVRTVLNSGNAVVTGPDEPTAEQATRIEDAITERTGLDVRAVVLTADALRTDLAVPEHTRAVGQVVYQWCPDGLMAAPPVGFPAGTVVTTRNWNTITKLAALL
jgi:uncharacterized protein (DUF1697 family)